MSRVWSASSSFRRLQKQWPSEGTYIAFVSPVFPPNTVVHIAAHPVDPGENALMNYIIDQYASVRPDSCFFFERG